MEDEIITVDEDLALYSVHERFAAPLYALVKCNQAWLQQSMDWPRHVSSLEDIRKTLQGNYLLHHRGYAKMFIIQQDDKPVGVISFNQIEPTNKTAWIGYWLAEASQGQHIMSRALQAFIHHYASSGLVRRFAIKCIVTNQASNRVAQRNGFSLEGCLRQAEYLNDEFHDVNVYGRIIDCQA